MNNNAITIFLIILFFLFAISYPVISYGVEENENIEGIYYIGTALNDKYILDIEEASKADTAKLQIWENFKIGDNQKFQIKSTGDGYYTIQVQHSGKALDVAGAGIANGTKVQQYTSNQTDAQKWQIVKNGDNTYSIISKCNGLYLDIPGAQAKNGVKLQVYEGNGTQAQKFKLFKIEDEAPGEQTIQDGIYKIKTASNTKIGLDIENVSDENGANVQIWTESNLISRNQRFQITYKGEGFYEIKAQHSGKSLDVAGAGKINGTNLQQYSSNGTDAQRWIIRDNKDGTYSIQSKVNRLYIDIKGGAIKDGSNVQMYEGNKSAAQKFVFEKLEKLTCENILEDGIYKISTALNPNMYLDIEKGSYKNQANLQIWSEGVVPQQKFKLKYNDQGYYEIISVNSGKVLDVAGSSNKNGANVQQYETNKTEYQKWILQYAGNGYYYIISRGAEAYLDIAGGNASNGANVQIYEGNGSLAQKFKISSYNEYKGIDVSHHNGDIDWAKVKKSGIDFAIIRCGYGQDMESQDDQKFEYNISECERLGIPYGVYIYSYALNTDNASSEADHVLRLLKGRNPEFGIWIDIEDDEYYSQYGFPSNEDFVNIATTFCEKIKENGYEDVGIYSNLDWFYGRLNDSRLDKYEKWVAQWGSECTYTKNYAIWQYTDKGKVDGIETNVDMNICYKKYF